ncbi:hypothetical protein Ae201684P_017043 [Aphanomyces euteiches]|uniref:Uncharacterized protein n=1 Tax=Aphanomyces euteiches TaxID=100861 RepID=A0A6G0WN03_9STRA|nr:hypothetical protein Ae201684_013666 [Aphanomyces euteiches]KAH9094436.1 hypothetical protein Ae201684P_017043 [Aphanomyces euteiches]
MLASSCSLCFCTLASSTPKASCLVDKYSRSSGLLLHGRRHISSFKRQRREKSSSQLNWSCCKVRWNGCTATESWSKRLSLVSPRIFHSHDVMLWVPVCGCCVFVPPHCK